MDKQVEKHYAHYDFFFCLKFICAHVENNQMLVSLDGEIICIFSF